MPDRFLAKRLTNKIYVSGTKREIPVLEPGGDLHTVKTHPVHSTPYFSIPCLGLFVTDAMQGKPSALNTHHSLFFPFYPKNWYREPLPILAVTGITIGGVCNPSTPPWREAILLLNDLIRFEISHFAASPPAFFIAARTRNKAAGPETHSRDAPPA